MKKLLTSAKKKTRTKTKHIKANAYCQISNLTESNMHSSNNTELPQHSEIVSINIKMSESLKTLKNQNP